MQQILTGKKRLPPFDQINTGNKQTELGEIPGDWEVVYLGHIFDFKNGLNKAKEYFGYGMPIVNYMDVYGITGMFSRHVNGKVDVTQLEQKNYSAKKGDVFFTRTSETVDEIGLASVLMDDIKNAVFSGFVLRARQKVEVFILEYMKYVFRSAESRKQIQSTASYTTRALTNGRLLANVLVSVPSKEEQTAIANVLSNMDKDLEALQQRLHKIHQIRQGMMQELLTGRTRLIGFM